MAINVRGMPQSASVKKATPDEIRILRDTCHVLAEWNVNKSLVESGSYPTEKHLNEMIDDETDRLILLARNHNTQFMSNMDEFLSDKSSSASQEHPDFVKTMKKMGLVTAKGHISKTAPKAAARQLGKTARSASLAGLGVKFDHTPQSGLGKIFSALKPNATIDLNKYGTPEESRVSEINKGSFRDSDLYRSEMENEAAQYAKMGNRASQSQKAFVKKIKQLGDDNKYSMHLEDRMTAGEQALYAVTKGTATLAAKGVGLAARGAWGLGKMAVSGIGSMIGKKAPTVEKVEETDPTVAPAKPLPYEPLVQTPAAARYIKPKTAGVAANENKYDGETAGETPAARYIMSKTAGVAANEEVPQKESGTKEEAADEEAVNSRQKTFEFQEKELSLLEKIDEDIKKIKLDGGSGSSGLLTGMLAMLPGLIGAALPLILSLLAGAAAMAAIKNIISNVKEADRLNADTKAKDTKLTEGLEHLDSPNKDKLLKYQKDMKEWTEAGQEKPWEFSSTYEKRLASRGAKPQAPEVEKLENVEQMKKEVSFDLDKKQEAAEVNISKKAATENAAAFGNVINNSSSNSQVLAPPSQTSKSKDNPRNPDNSLSLYLNSRVSKFA